MLAKLRWGGWDPIVIPWHLDEHIPAFPIPTNVTETMSPALPAGPAPARLPLRYQAVAGMPGRATGDVTAAGIACGWRPDRVGDRTTRETITRLAGALGADVAWSEPARR